VACCSGGGDHEATSPLGCRTRRHRSVDDDGGGLKANGGAGSDGGWQRDSTQLRERRCGSLTTPDPEVQWESEAA